MRLLQYMGLWYLKTRRLYYTLLPVDTTCLLLFYFHGYGKKLRVDEVQVARITQWVELYYRITRRAGLFFLALRWVGFRVGVLELGTRAGHVPIVNIRHGPGRNGHPAFFFTVNSGYDGHAPWNRSVELKSSWRIQRPGAAWFPLPGHAAEVGLTSFKTVHGFARVFVVLWEVQRSDGATGVAAFLGDEFARVDGEDVIWYSGVIGNVGGTEFDQHLHWHGWYFFAERIRGWVFWS